MFGKIQANKNPLVFQKICKDNREEISQVDQATFKDEVRMGSEAVCTNPSSTSFRTHEVLRRLVNCCDLIKLIFQYEIYLDFFKVYSDQSSIQWVKFSI